MDRRSLKWNRVAIVAFVMIMMLVVLAGGTVLLLQEGESAAAEGLVVALQPSAPCLPAGGTFGGVSTITDNGGDGVAFETCFQFRNDFTYCWTKSYSWYENLDSGNSLCAPNGDAWYAISANYVNTPGVDPNTNPKQCGTPCQGQHRED